MIFVLPFTVAENNLVLNNIKVITLQTSAATTYVRICLVFLKYLNISFNFDCVTSLVIHPAFQSASQYGSSNIH